MNPSCATCLFKFKLKRFIATNILTYTIYTNIYLATMRAMKQIASCELSLEMKDAVLDV